LRRWFGACDTEAPRPVIVIRRHAPGACFSPVCDPPPARWLHCSMQSQVRLPALCRGLLAPLVCSPVYGGRNL